MMFELPYCMNMDGWSPWSHFPEVLYLTVKNECDSLKVFLLMFVYKLLDLK